MPHPWYVTGVSRIASQGAWDGRGSIMAEKTETTNWWSRQSKLVRVAIVVVGLIIVVSLLAVGDEDGTVETAVTETTLAEETETTASSTTETETTEGPTTTTTEPTTTTTAAPTTTVPAPNVYTGSGDSVLDIELSL